MWPGRRSRDRLLARLLVGAVLPAGLLALHWLGAIKLDR
jgi:hypothetical protein